MHCKSNSLFHIIKNVVSMRRMLARYYLTFKNYMQKTFRIFNSSPPEGTVVFSNVDLCRTLPTTRYTNSN